MKMLIVSCLLVLNNHVHSQTCIVIYVSPHGIVAGADRKYHQTVTGPGRAHRIYYDKKIFISNHCAWALAGADYYDTIHAVCRAACVKNGSLQIIVSRFCRSMNKLSVKKAMHQLFTASNDEQKTRFKENLTAIVFFKFDGTAYKAYRVTLSMPGIFSNDETLRMETDSITATKNTVGLFVLGHYESFASNTHPEQWVNPAATIKQLIKRQAKRTPAEVGSESDVLRVLQSGFYWVEQKDAASRNK